MKKIKAMIADGLKVDREETVPIALHGQLNSFWLLALEFQCPSHQVHRHIWKAGYSAKRVIVFSSSLGSLERSKVLGPY